MNKFDYVGNYSPYVCATKDKDDNNCPEIPIVWVEINGYSECLCYKCHLNYLERIGEQSR